MAARKRTSRKADVPPSGTAEGRFSILMEQMLEQNRGTIEAVQSLEQKMDRRFNDSEERADLRFKSLEAAVRMNSADIRKNSEKIERLISVTDQLGRDLRGLTARVERIEAVLSMKVDGPSTGELEARIRRLEERLGLSAGPTS